MRECRPHLRPYPTEETAPVYSSRMWFEGTMLLAFFLEQEVPLHGHQLSTSKSSSASLCQRQLIRNRHSSQSLLQAASP